MQIYNYDKRQPVGNFRGHLEVVRSVSWDPDNPDQLFSGGDDALLRWSLTTLEAILPPKQGQIERDHFN